MAEPLAVDPARLIAAASKLGELVFPAPPAPMSVTGSDAMSSAISQTMPGIESLVTEGLPGVTASLKRTATSMSTAADIYTQADQSLGQALSQYGFGADGQSLSANAMSAMAGGPLGAGAGAAAAMLGGPAGAAQQLVGAAASGGAVSQVGAAASAQAEALSPQIAATVPQLVQLAPLAQQMAPMGQQVGQSIQQAASQAGQSGGSSAQLASDTKPADEEKKDDDGKDGAEGPDGAAAGNATLVSAPVQTAGGGTPPAGSVAAPI
ncbi:hypothetical protein [Mycobacterium sp.]|jgi:hypothetical protein|uniref:hypothetical protein n=1 Tax=Mycobacterium sp. TaxID=1785 RepID=UPI000CA7E88D|nr:hypothetical protein [Mycobacterium sp.]MBI2699998.1 hypothetical protein [Mycobacterium sp.]PJE12367.1 MAG: hypothetical protein CK428_12610 [Mycobacterium sp.]